MVVVSSSSRSSSSSRDGRWCGDEKHIMWW